MSLLHAPVINFLHSALQPEPFADGEAGTPPTLSTLVYQSRPVKLFTEAQLQELLVHARAKNHANSITGLLVYDHGCFFQWLEGPPAAVAEIWAAIRRDPRHGDIEVLGEKQIAKRLFSEWDMRLAWRKDSTHISIQSSVEVPDAMLADLRANPDQDSATWSELAALNEQVEAEPAPQLEPSYELIGEVVASELIPRLLMVHRSGASDESAARDATVNAKKGRPRTSSFHPNFRPLGRRFVRFFLTRHKQYACAAFTCDDLVASFYLDLHLRTQRHKACAA